VAVQASAAEGGGIDFEGVTVAYRSGPVLEDFSLSVAPGEIAAVIGPSGSGKTTALKAVAGFVRPVQGRIRIAGRDVTDLPPQDRDLGMVVQNYALFPHMRVGDNVAFGLHARRMPEETVRRRVAECLEMVGMAGYHGRFPRELSGGQQQRVAIARALAIRPGVLLLDEPLSALDAQIRRSMLEELARLHRELPSLTILYVTHDQSEALTLAHRIAILRGGRLVSYGPARSLYRSPPDRFTAEFLGRANLVPVAMDGLEADGQLARVHFDGVSLTARPHPAVAPGQDCLLCIRPHDLAFHPDGRHDGNCLTGTVCSTVWQGDQHAISLEIGPTRLRMVSPPLPEPPEPGARIRVHFPPDGASLIPVPAAEAARHVG
jgi:2-aminoethylphosphonate transport system ATP-binding protein